MKICFYDNVTVIENAKLCGRNKNYIFYEKSFKFKNTNKDKEESWIIVTDLQPNTNNNIFYIEREPNNSEAMEFMFINIKEIKRYLIEKIHNLHIDNQLELDLCNMLGLFNYKKPKEFVYFK